MKQILLSLLLIFSASAFANNFKPLTCSGAKSLVKQHSKKTSEHYYKFCQNGMYHQIREAAKAGNRYKHIMISTCYGDLEDKIANELLSKGFGVVIDYVGKTDVHYETVFTVYW